MLYQSKISSRQVVNKKTGKVKLEEFDIKVDGYRNRRKLREAKEAYNTTKEIGTKHERDDWPKAVWYYLFRNYYNNLKTLELTIKRNRKNTNKNC